MPWDFDLEGRVRRIRDKYIRVEEQLTEVFGHDTKQQHCLTLARDRDTDEPYLLKVRYDLNPRDFDEIEDIQEHQAYVKEHCLTEINLADAVHDIGHAPELVYHIVRTQGEKFPYPPGKVYFFLMKRVPGEPLDEILDELSAAQLASIRTQITRILEHMRLNGGLLLEHHPGFFWYDTAADKLYMVDFTFCAAYDPQDSSPITEDSMDVLAFKIWTDHLDENAPLWGTEPHPARAPAPPEEEEKKEEPGPASSARPPRAHQENVRPAANREASSSKKGPRRPPWRH